MAYCESCGTEIAAGVKFCPECGARQGGAVAAKLAAPAPETKKGGKSKILIVVGLGVIAACVCLAIGVATLGDGDGAASRPAEVSKSGGAPRPTATPIPAVPPFMEIRDTVQSMTEVQWKRYLEGFDGQMIEGWTGWVVEVDQSLGGKYTVWVDMDDPETLLSTQDVYIPVSESVAFELSKGIEVTFSGQIKSITELFGSLSFRLEEGAVIEY